MQLPLIRGAFAESLKIQNNFALLIFTTGGLIPASYQCFMEHKLFLEETFRTEDFLPNFVKF